MAAGVQLNSRHHILIKCHSHFNYTSSLTRLAHSTSSASIQIPLSAANRSSRTTISASSGSPNGS